MDLDEFDLDEFDLDEFMAALAEVDDDEPKREYTDAEKAVWVDKIRKLLAKAERAGSEQEAELYNAKAQQLISKFGVAAMMAEAAKPAAGRAPIVDKWIIVTAPYVTERGSLLYAIGKAFGCEGIYRAVGPDWHLHLVGAEADLLRTEVLFASLTVQMQRELGWALARTMVQGAQRKVYSRDFMTGYRSRIHERLLEAEGKAHSEGGQSVALAVVDRTALVLKRFAELYPKTTQKRTVRSGPGVFAGIAAANRAQLADRTDVAGGAGRQQLVR